MLKNKLWIVALFAALTMAFVGCTNLAEGLDDGSGPVPAEDLVLEGSKIELGSVGNTSSLINGTKVTILGGTSTGFYIQLPAEGVDVYPNVIVYMKVDNVVRGRPGLLMKTTTQMNANVGGVPDTDNYYQLNDVGGEGTEFTTGLQKANQFTANRFVFQHQAWQPQPGNADAEYTIEVLKVVFPGTGGSVDEGYPPRIYAIPSLQSDKPADEFYEPNANIRAQTFFVNLNDQRDGIAVGGGTPAPADPVKGTLADDGITLAFTKPGQRAFFKLTAVQVALLTEANSVKITVGIDGTTTQQFRYGLGDSTAASGWNGSNLTAFSSTFGTAQTLTFSGTKSGDTVGMFVIQISGSATPTNLKIEYIQIEAVKRTLSGILTIESASGLSFAKYTGIEPVSFTWTRGSTVIGTQQSIYYTDAYYALYTVTASAYGYDSLSAVDNTLNVSRNVIFSGTAESDEILAGSLTAQSDPKTQYTTNPSVVATSDGKGFTFTYGIDASPVDPDDVGEVGWENEYATFTLNFSGVDVKKFTQVTFRVVGSDENAGWKNFNVLASDSAITGKQDGASLRIIDQFQTGDTRLSAAPGPLYTRDIITTKTADLTGTTINFSFFLNLGGDAAATQGKAYTITDVKLH